MYLLLRIFIFCLPNGILRTKWIEKFHIFAQTGKNFYFCPRKLPADPKLIKFHDNVSVATDVMFINHDVSQKVFNYIKCEKLPKYYGCIEIGNNVFIGAKVIILPNIKVCDNVFIAAGTVVTKSIEESGVYAGVPARKIGEVDKLYNERINNYKYIVQEKQGEELNRLLWDNFNDK